MLRSRRAIARKLTMMGQHFRNAMSCALTMDAGEVGLGHYDDVIATYETEIKAYVRVLKSVCVLHSCLCFNTRKALSRVLIAKYHCMSSQVTGASMGCTLEKHGTEMMNWPLHSMVRSSAFMRTQLSCTCQLHLPPCDS
jgi:hypothetical protein